MKVLLTLIFLIIGKEAFSQLNDTLFYDKQWSICEPPIAKYYRVCTLVSKPFWGFQDDVKDYYYKTGNPEMTGYYAKGGYCNGHFIFYNENGSIKKEGDFINGIMRGIWSYYDTIGNLVFKASVQDVSHFTPLTIILNKDTLLNNGNGSFEFNTQDFPTVFDGTGFLIKGRCKDGEKEGEWIYNWNGLSPEYCFLKENYENGVFKNGIEKSIALGIKETTGPNSLLNIHIEKLRITESLQADIIFDIYATLNKRNATSLTNFLLKDDKPVINSKSSSFKNNIVDFANLVKYSIDFNQIKPTIKNIEFSGFTDPNFKEDHADLLTVVVSANNKLLNDSSQKNILNTNFYMQLKCTLLGNGTLSGIETNSNLPEDAVDHIKYYYSKLRKLSPWKEDHKIADYPISLYIFTRKKIITYQLKNYEFIKLIISLNDEKHTPEDEIKVEDYKIEEGFFE